MIAQRHDDLCGALVEAGGELIDSLMPNDASEERADILFRGDGVIAEVKALTTDRNKTPSVKKKAGDILAKWASRGLAPMPVGEVSIPLQDLHPEAAEELLRNLGRRVTLEITKANAQIRASKAYLNQPNAVGLCAFITSAEFDVHSGVIVTAAARHLRGVQCSSIDELLIIAVPNSPEPGERTSGYISFHPRAGHPSVPTSLKHRMAEAWISRAARMTGTSAGMEHADPEEFENLFVVPVRE